MKPGLSVSLSLGLALAFATAGGVARAELPSERPGPAEDATSEGFSLIEEGAKLLLRGLMAEMEPVLDDMAGAVEELRPRFEALGPQLEELLRLVDDIGNYHAPERLPNGDILIRRKIPLAAPEADPSPLPPPGGARPDGILDL
ncbi:hypothetical protein [Pseudogemmobacter sonorensis]|uniref:hypothetical protein n=1 Tax=Pseudogemmobacter sonorensis TaxID=2989681 RepID=UPI0036A1E6AA